MPFENMILVVLVVLLIIIAMSGCSLLYLLLRNSRFSGPGSGATGADMTNQMILFQSMRETVDQQKELARQLNFSIDKKVQDVREIVQSAATIDQRISGAEQELETLIHDTKE